MTDKSFIHIFIILKGVVLQPSLQLLPKLIDLVDRRISGFGFNAIALVLLNLFFLVAQFVKRFGIYAKPFMIAVSPSELISSVSPLRFACPKHGSRLVFSFCSRHNSLSSYIRNCLSR